MTKMVFHLWKRLVLTSGYLEKVHYSMHTQVSAAYEVTISRLFLELIIYVPSRRANHQSQGRWNNFYSCLKQNLLH